MKKYISVFTIMVMIFLAACSNQNTSSTPTSNENNTQSNSVTKLDEARLKSSGFAGVILYFFHICPFCRILRFVHYLYIIWNNPPEAILVYPYGGETYDSDFCGRHLFSQRLVSGPGGRTGIRAENEADGVPFHPLH